MNKIKSVYSSILTTDINNKGSLKRRKKSIENKYHRIRS